MKNISIIVLLSIVTIIGCTKEDKDNAHNDEILKNLTIFFVNDIHAQLNNFSKIKYIVEKEKEKTNVLIACSGDIFSGNPVVDNYSKKGYPIIDIMNEVGFDISVLGNHEFDYGESNLKDRINQANFDWVCANIDMGNTGIPDPFEYKTISIDNLSVTFLGLVETNGKEDATIPSTHPWKIKNITFEKPENVISNFAKIKEQENSDLYIVLSHLGYDNNENLGDIQLAKKYPFFDLIIGGHSHQKINTTKNEIPIFQSGAYLNYLGKIELEVKNKKIESINYNLIDLNSYTNFDSGLKSKIDEYNALPYLNEIIGYSHLYHNKLKVGCFFTEAMRKQMNVDVAFQNTGGVRSDLNEGDITKREIFEIAPFNNGTIAYEMTAAEIKNFLIKSKSGFYYSGIQIDHENRDIIFTDMTGRYIPDDKILTVGVNDYIAAVHEDYFPENGQTQTLTAAETIIAYLVEINSQVNYPDCNHYFKY